jgi:hypothetical protein
VIDQLGNFVNDAGHRLVQVGLIHYGQRVAHVHAVHTVDHVARIVGVEAVSRSADAR